MGELITQLGIDWRLILAQLFNFILLLIVLERFVYRPVLKIIDDRRAQIEENEKREERLEKKLSGIDSMKEKVVSEANAEARKLREETLEQAEETKKHILATARKEAEALIESQRDSLKSDFERLEERIHNEIGDVVAKAVEKSVGELLNEEEKNKILNRSIEEFKSEYQRSSITPSSVLKERN
ncbi:MAG: ATP synthase F0 subunit B [Candidatus Campbellbacteria bacterium]|nr:ATP synthase F0 subunit B [Candidatus Campbellbacteria bacterium]